VTGTLELPERVAAPAKVNLFLRVLGRREDGYHDLETVVLPVGLADTLEFRAAADPAASDLSLSLRVDGPPELVRGVPSGEANLVLRAARALAERGGVRGFAQITLEKAVPSAAGLGGGSADAAATIRTLDRLWGCGLDEAALGGVAAAVGSDVPALLHGGPVLARGRGERVEPVEVPRLTWLVCPFDFAVSTADAFDWWDQDGGVSGPDPEALIAAAAAARDSSDAFGRETLGRTTWNDLERPVVRRHPVVGRALKALRSRGAAAAVLSGSGPTVAGLFARGLADAERNRRLEEHLGEITGRPPVWVVSPGSS
jgi:4-diphosphocytidyl-2-C-methyl-D-erythritol kinase